MSEQDAVDCLGLCDIDWEAGVCQGCGRATDEIFGTEAESASTKPQTEDE